MRPNALLTTLRCRDRFGGMQPGSILCVHALNDFRIPQEDLAAQGLLPQRAVTCRSVDRAASHRVSLNLPTGTVARTLYRAWTVTTGRPYRRE